MISGSRREADENCTIVGYYAESSSNFLPTFRDNLLGPSWRLKMVPTGCPETSVKIAITRCLMTQKSAVITRITFADYMQVTRANDIVAALRKMDDACLSAVFNQAIVIYWL